MCLTDRALKIIKDLELESQAQTLEWDKLLIEGSFVRLISQV